MSQTDLGTSMPLTQVTCLQARGLGEVGTTMILNDYVEVLTVVFWANLMRCF